MKNKLIIFILFSLGINWEAFGFDLGVENSFLSGKTVLATRSTNVSFINKTTLWLKEKESDFLFLFDFLKNNGSTQIISISGGYSKNVYRYNDFSFAGEFDFGLAKLNESNFLYQNTNYGLSSGFKIKTFYQVSLNSSIYLFYNYSHIWITKSAFDLWGRKENLDDTVFNLSGLGIGLTLNY